MTHIQFRRFPTLIASAMIVLCLLPSTTFAQLIGPNIKGDAGVKAGSQAPPGAYVTVPLWFYTADAVKDRDGNEILTGTLDSAVFGVALTVVTRKKASWRQLRGPRRPAVGKQSRAGRRRLRQQCRLGVDGHVRPADQSGLDHTARRLHRRLRSVPSHGTLEDGASNNTGLGMVGQEILLGTTIYLNTHRSLHVATVATFDFFSEKKDSETKVGNILNLEGGFGADSSKAVSWWASHITAPSS